MESGISNNWQNVQLKPLTHEEMKAPHYNYKGGRNIPAAAIPSDRYSYGEPQEKKGSLSGFLLKTAAVIGGLYVLARFGKKITPKEGDKFGETAMEKIKKTTQFCSEKYAGLFDTSFGWLKKEAISLKNKITKNKDKIVQEAAEVPLYTVV